MEEEGLDGQKSTHELFFILLYVDDVVYFSYTLHDILDTFFQISGLTISVNKTKIIEIKAIQPREYPTITYKGEQIQVVKSNLGINISRLQEGLNDYYMFDVENQTQLP